MSVLLLLLIGHAVCDYPLQGDWLSKAKNHTLTLVPGETIWPGALASHSLIHAGAVWLITQSWMLAAFEFFAHATIDYSKCAGRISYNQDQGMHAGCKLAWATILAVGVA